MPHLAVLVHSFHPVGDHIRAALRDPSGELEATIHGQAVEDFPQISVGASIVLRNVSVYRATRMSLSLVILSENIANVWNSSKV